jgi:hypothetical protein
MHPFTRRSSAEASPKPGVSTERLAPIPTPMADTDDQAEELRRLRHDLRGAFNELRLCVEVLRVETDGARVLEWLESIEAAAGKCAALVRQLQELR